ncbi:MAG: hypothetical protein J5716_05465 [Alphaproteobacteria bacterium]|nr:hypothetical protein [Alphaproteobacteria bacterium]
MKKRLFLLAGLLILVANGVEARSYKLGRDLYSNGDDLVNPNSFKDVGNTPNSSGCRDGKVYNPVIKKCVNPGCGEFCSDCVSTAQGNYCAGCVGEGEKKTYLSPSEGLCHYCYDGPEGISNCDLCTKNKQSLRCEACGSNLTLQNNQCVPETCPQGQVFNTKLGKCVTEGCGSGCADCVSTDRGFFCAECEAGRGFYLSENGVESANGTCMICPKTYHSDNEESRSPSKCIKCPYNNSAFQGPWSPAGSTQASCSFCDVGCKDCSSTQHQCIECYEGYTKEGNSCVAQGCSEGQVYHPVLQDCVPAGCENNCSYCVDDAYCYTCPAGTFLSSMGTCQTCPKGTYTATANRQTACTPCEKGTYNNSTGSTSCTPCDAGKYSSAQGSQSCSNCPSGKYSKPGAEQCETCSTLIPHCTTCTYNGGALKCTACASGYNVQNGECVENPCSAGQAYNSAIGKCVTAGCSTCNGVAGACQTDEAGQSYCSKCASSSYLSRDDGACHTCSSAIDHCSACSMSQNGTIICSSCTSGFEPSGTGTSCVSSSCDSGYFLSPCTGNCAACPAACGTCSAPGSCGTNKSAAICSTCSAGYTGPSNGRCYKNCSSGQYWSYSANSCQSCPTHCSNCYHNCPYTGYVSVDRCSTTCTACDSADYQVSNGLCVEKHGCTSGQIWHPTLQLCITSSCVANCKSYVQDNKYQTCYCAECNLGYTLNNRGECVACSTITSHCATCQTEVSKGVISLVCKGCDNNYNLSGGSCVAQQQNAF